MSPFLQLILVLAVILLAAKTAGHISTRFGQPSVLGELLVGLVLGPTLVDLTHLSFITDSHLDEVVIEMGELGVLLLMFLAGLELSFGDLSRDKRISVYGGILGVIVPIGLGWLGGSLLGYSQQQAIFLGLALGATSVSISAQTLIELKALRSRVGMGLLGAAILDDVLVILILSAFLAVQQGGNGILEVSLVLVRMILFLLLSVAFGLYILPGVARWVKNLSVSQSTLTLAIVIMLVYALAAELVGGVAAITGSFLAGLMFSRTQDKIEIESKIRSLAYGFFVPIFFISIGLTIDLGSLKPSSLTPFIVITLIAIVGKILGAGLGSRIGGFNWKEATQFGIGMTSRGEVGLIIAQVGITEAILNNELFSSLVGMVLVTTILTPPMLRAAFAGSDPAGHPPPLPVLPAESPEEP